MTAEPIRFALQTVLPEAEGEPIWERQPTESMQWWTRFVAYRNQGPGRSIRMAQQEEAVQQGRLRPIGIGSIETWRQAAIRYRWVERAESWDEYQLSRREAEKEKERAEAKRQRIDILNAWTAQLLQSMQTVNPLRANHHDITEGLRMVMDQLRKEYDDEPTQRIQARVGRDGRMGQIPAGDVRKLFNLVKRAEAEQAPQRARVVEATVVDGRHVLREADAKADETDIQEDTADMEER